MTGELDIYGHLIDPTERYEGFLHELYYLIATAGDYGYSREAVDLLRTARLRFLDEFEKRHPGVGKGEPILQP